MLKRAVSLVLCVCMLAFLYVPNVFAETIYPADVRENYDGNYNGELVILHTNDIHGRLDGYAKMAYLKEYYELRGAQVILVDVGDFSQGTPYVSEYKGADAITAMNAAGYQIAVPGNHDFDYGTNALMQNLTDAKFEVVCANILRDGVPVFDQHSVFTAKNGAKIGFFGLDTPETQSKSNPEHVKGLTFLAGQKMYDCAREQVAALKNEKADLVIALTHLGVDDESAADGNRSLDLYHNVSGIDLILDGHSHTEMTSGDQGEPIQSTQCYSAFIGAVIIDKDAKIKDRYLIDEKSLPMDAGVKTVTDQIEAVVNAQYDIPFAQSEITLDGDREKMRVQETTMGDLTTDALVWFVTSQGTDLGVDRDHVIGLYNGGGIRDGIDVGAITKKDIATIFPFGNTVGVAYVNGSELLEALEASTFCTPDDIGGYPQTKGIRFTVNTTIPYDKGELYPDSTYYRPASIRRVTIEDINGKPFDPNAMYAVVTNDFVCMGGDTYYVIGSKESKDTGALVDDVITKYINTELHGTISASMYSQTRHDQTIITDSGSVQE